MQLEAEQETTDAALIRFQEHGFEARQALLPATVQPRLIPVQLPIFDLTSPAFCNEMFGPLTAHDMTKLLEATDTRAAKLLMAPMRDAQIKGRYLREAYRRVGWHLATQYICDTIEIEDHSNFHVYGTTIIGHRFFREDKITIVARMRGGEPMTFGVNDAAPTARFVHASSPEDLKKHHIEGQVTLVPAGSVVNSRKTIHEFIDDIRNIHAMIRIVVVAGVVQEGVIAEDELNKFSNVRLVPLRTSKNKYTGRGTTGTGNRLFYKTYLD